MLVFSLLLGPLFFGLKFRSLSFFNTRRVGAVADFKDFECILG
jgi:hypothetical protein